MEDINFNVDFDFDEIDLFSLNTDENNTIKQPQQKKRGSVAYYELRNSFVYKRAHSELQLLNILDDKKLCEGVSYNFITSGDVDQLSFLQLVLRTIKNLDYLLCSTWCASSEDILYLFNLHEEKRLNKLDLYVGEIFKRSYPKEFSLIQNKYKEYPIGTVKLFKNHAKIFAGRGTCGRCFVIQSSANLNTNPRTENAVIQLDNGLFEFYKAYFDGIKSFNIND